MVNDALLNVHAIKWHTPQCSQIDINESTIHTAQAGQEDPNAVTEEHPIAQILHV